MRREEVVIGSAARKRLNDTQIHPIREERRRAKQHRRLSVSDMAVVLLCLGLMIFAALTTIRLQTELNLARKEYAGLQAEYEEQKRANDLYEERIISKVDMGEVARIAEEELGMKAAGKGQIVSYSGQIDDYVKQFTDVPEP
ncbi:MAG: hypothetical protein K6E50_12925 [Lachnospiraceae bacterium]|nr:hypothetical protein [Lachnospiraceae bacterium]